jgi:hypothetical protein
MRSVVEPVERIISQLSSMTQEVLQSWAAVKPRGATFSVSAHAEWEERLRSFNSLLQPHTWHLVLGGFRPRDGKAVPVFMELPTQESDAGLMFRLIQLARAGRLDRLRTCAWCGIWFFARTPWAECHDSKCKKKKNDSKPGAKESHAQTAAQHYRMRVSPNADLYQQGFSPDEVRLILKSKKGKRNRKRGKR